MVEARNLVQGQQIAQKWHSLQLAIVQKAAKLKALKKSPTNSQRPPLRWRRPNTTVPTTT